MSVSFQRLLAGIVCAAACPLALSAPTVEHEVAALFGLEYDDIQAGSPIRPGIPSCIETGTRPLRVSGESRDDWRAASAQCGTRRVELLKRRVAEQEGGRPRWRIEDVLLLPALPADRSRFVAGEGDCVLSDAPGTSFVALLRRRGNRAPAAAQVWVYDLDEGRMQQQPPGGLECRPTQD